MSFKLDTKTVERNLHKLENKTQKMLKMKGTEGAKIFENYAKENRRWTDRTGNARQTLHGYVEQYKNGIKICIAHGMYYGIFLELANGRRFEILKSTIMNCSEQVMRMFHIDKGNTGGTGF